MRRLILILFLFFAYSFIFHGCGDGKQAGSKQFSLLVTDYLPEETINQTFWEADSLRWETDYFNAIAAYSVLNEEGKLLELEENVYCLNQIIYCYVRTNDFEKALFFIKKLELILRRNQEFSKGLIADYNYNKGLILLNEENKVALSYFKTAERLYRKIYGANHFKVLETLNALGQCNFEIYQQPDSAYYFYELAHQIINDNPVLKPFAKETYRGITQSCIYQRDHFKGLIYAEQALSLAKKSNFIDTLFISKCLNLKGRMIKKMGKTEEAKISYLEGIRLLEIYDEQSPILQKLYRNLMINCIAQQDTVEFFALLKKGEQQFPPSKRKYFFRENLLGYYYHNQNNTIKSIQFYEQFVQYYLNFPNPDNLLVDEAYYLLASQYKKKKAFDLAAKYVIKNMLFGANIQDSLKNFQEIIADKLTDKKSYQFVFYGQLAGVYLDGYKEDTLKLDYLKNAFFLYKKLDSLIFRKIVSVEEDAILTYLNDVGKEVYSNALNSTILLDKIYHQREYLEWANIFMDRMKSFVFYRNLLAKNQANVDFVDKKLQEEEINLKSDLKELKLEKLNKLSIYTPSLDNQIYLLLKRQEELYHLFQKNYPDYYQKKINQPIPSLSIVQETVRLKKEAIIQYQIEEKQIYTLIITTDTVSLLRIETGDAFKDDLIHYIDLLKNEGELSEFLRYSHDIYETIISPVEPFLSSKTDRILIIADGLLGFIPFESLINQSEKQENTIGFKNLPYLLNKWNICYSASLKLYINNLSHLKKIKPTTSILGYAYSEIGREKSSFGNLFRAEKHSELYYSAEELNNINDIFSEADKTLRYKNQSSKSDFLNNYQNNHEIIHFALHAQSSTTDKLDNKIIFRQTKENEDYRLFGYEIMRLNIPAQLVYISSCETALGPAMAGEGTYSLTRAFFLAGAKRVISSLWKIDDYSSSQIAQSFYYSLKNGISPSEALQYAKKTYLKKTNGNLTHPKYWAGVICFQ